VLEKMFYAKKGDEITGLDGRGLVRVMGGHVRGTGG